MTDDRTQPDPNDRSEEAKPKRSGQDALQRQAGVPDATVQSSQPSLSGRKPLFRS
jgi:hypothetical protein